MEFWIIIIAFIAIASGVSKKKQDDLKKRGQAENTNRQQTVYHQTTSFPKQPEYSDQRYPQQNIDSEAQMERQMKRRQDQVHKQQRQAQEGERRHEQNLNKNRSDRSYQRNVSDAPEQSLTGYKKVEPMESMYRARNKNEEDLQLQKDRRESQARKKQNDEKRKSEEIEAIRKKDILSRASQSVGDDFETDTSELDQVSFMEQVNNLIVMGPSAELAFDRDFVGEAIDMLNH